MPKENVALVRELAEMFQRRQRERALEYYADVVIFDVTKSPVPLVAGVYHGKAICGASRSGSARN